MFTELVDGNEVISAFSQPFANGSMNTLRVAQGTPGDLLDILRVDDNPFAFHNDNVSTKKKKSKLGDQLQRGTSTPCTPTRGCKIAENKMLKPKTFFKTCRKYDDFGGRRLIVGM